MFGFLLKTKNCDNRSTFFFRLIGDAAKSLLKMRPKDANFLRFYQTIICYKIKYLCELPKGTLFKEFLKKRTRRDA